MGKLPGFTFYPKDWLTDVALIGCSKAAKGVWIDMLCLMFFAPNRGVLATGGSAWSDQEVAERIGGPVGTNLECITELLAKGVASRNQAGAIFSRRMVRDEQDRQHTKERVQKHRRNANKTPDVTAKYGDGDGREDEVSSSLASKKQELPDWIPVEPWEHYREMRRRIRKPMTSRAVLLAIGKLDALRKQGHDPTQVLEQSVFNSWQGLFEIRGNGNEQTSKSRAEERYQRIVANTRTAFSGGASVSPAGVPGTGSASTQRMESRTLDVRHRDRGTGNS